MDPDVAKLTTKARLPGFYHNKREPWLIKMIYDGAHAHYTTDEVCGVARLEEAP